jgi:hypothetical protein
MRLPLAGVLFLLVLALGGCSLPAPYETYPPSTPPPPPPRAPNALTVTGGTTTTPDNEMDIGGQPMTTSAPAPAPASALAPAPSSSAGRQVAICYNRLWNSAVAVRSAAQQACGGKQAPRVVSQDTDLDACPVLTPSHAVYACGAP